MAKKVKNMLKNNMVLCVLILAAIGLTSVVFAVDFKVKEGKIKDAAIFGSWTDEDSESNTLVKDGVYKATSDGFITALSGTVTGHISGYTGGSNPPTTRVGESGTGNTAGEWTICFPVKKNDYWKVTVTSGTPNIYWLPIGNGECEKQ